MTPANPSFPVQTPDSGHIEFRNRRIFGSLDGLRALSVVAVIWHHTTGPHVSALLASGPHGVTLFFAISGFLIVTLLLRERDRAGRIDLKAFYIRRSLRIFPLYYAVIAVYTLLVCVVERNNPVGREFFNNLPFFLIYTSNWFVLLEGRVIFRRCKPNLPVFRVCFSAHEARLERPMTGLRVRTRVRAGHEKFGRRASFSIRKCGAHSQ